MAREKEFNLQNFVISVVIVGVVLVVGIYINSSMGTVLSLTNSASATNESQSIGLNSTHNITVSQVSNWPSFALTGVSPIVNSSGFVLPAANYSFNSAGLIYPVGTTNFNGSSLNVTYTFTYLGSTVASNASDNVTSALSTGTSWISILVVVGFAVIILRLLTGGLSEAAGSEQSTPYY